MQRKIKLIFTSILMLPSLALSMDRQLNTSENEWELSEPIDTKTPIDTRKTMKAGQEMFSDLLAGLGRIRAANSDDDDKVSDNDEKKDEETQDEKKRRHEAFKANHSEVFRKLEHIHNPNRKKDQKSEEDQKTQNNKPEVKRAQLQAKYSEAFKNINTLFQKRTGSKANNITNNTENQTDTANAQPKLKTPPPPPPLPPALKLAPIPQSGEKINQQNVATSDTTQKANYGKINRNFKKYAVQLIEGHLKRRLTKDNNLSIHVMLDHYEKRDEQGFTASDIEEIIVQANEYYSKLCNDFDYKQKESNSNFLQEFINFVSDFKKLSLEEEVTLYFDKIKKDVTEKPLMIGRLKVTRDELDNDNFVINLKNELAKILIAKRNGKINNSNQNETNQEDDSNKEIYKRIDSIFKARVGQVFREIANRGEQRSLASMLENYEVMYQKYLTQSDLDILYEKANKIFIEECEVANIKPVNSYIEAFVRKFKSLQKLSLNDEFEYYFKKIMKEAEKKSLTFGHFEITSNKLSDDNFIAELKLYLQHWLEAKREGRDYDVSKTSINQESIEPTQVQIPEHYKIPQISITPIESEKKELVLVSNEDPLKNKGELNNLNVLLNTGAKRSNSLQFNSPHALRWRILSCIGLAATLSLLIYKNNIKTRSTKIPQASAKR